VINRLQPLQTCLYCLVLCVIVTTGKRFTSHWISPPATLPRTTILPPATLLRVAKCALLLVLTMCQLQQVFPGTSSHRLIAANPGPSVVSRMQATQRRQKPPTTAPTTTMTSHQPAHPQRRYHLQIQPSAAHPLVTTMPMTAGTAPTRTTPPAFTAAAPRTTASAALRTVRSPPFSPPARRPSSQLRRHSGTRVRQMQVPDLFPRRCIVFYRLYSDVPAFRHHACSHPSHPVAIGAALVPDSSGSA
jgi:hypothetical protein